MEIQKILFSIIVPAYNSAAFIQKCIESVLNQTYSGFELLLVDDGSTDDTLSICRTYAASDPRVKVIHKENGGHTSARNAGLKIAAGDYVLFLDSDDWISAQTLESCHAQIVINEPDIVVYRMQNSDSPHPYSVLLPDGCYDVHELEKSSNNDFVISAVGNFIFPKSLSAKCFKRDIIFDAQLNIPKEILLGEDGAAFIGALLKARKICVIAGDVSACYYCLIRPNSVSRSADTAAFEKATILLLYYDSVLKNARVDYSSQFNRYVVARLYTATLLVLRSGGNNENLNAGLHIALGNPTISGGLKKAHFNLKGYKFIIKKIILRYRLWGIAKFLDRIEI